MKTKLLIAILALGWLCSEIALAQAPDTLFISTAQVVHIRFGSELKYVNLGNKAIVAKIVDGSKDYVAVKAREPFDICTSMSCLESTGAMHTFLVAYREYPQRLDVDTRIPVRPAGTAGPSEARPSAPADTSFSFSAHSFQTISEMPKELYHIGAKDYGIEVFCDNLLVRDDVLFIVFSIKNGSSVSYDLSDPRFAIESRRKTKRGLQYEKAIFPRQSYGLGVTAPDGTSRPVFTFDKVTLTRGQVLRVYFYERGGSRNFCITFSQNDINKARRL